VTYLAGDPSPFNIENVIASFDSLSETNNRPYNQGLGISYKGFRFHFGRLLCRVLIICREGIDKLIFIRYKAHYVRSVYQRETVAHGL
jgi:hypothetical protein